MEEAGKSFRRNLSYSVIAQVVSVLVGLVFNLFVPKYLAVEEFALYQTYALYVAFVGFLHFGLLDGILLRYAEYDYDVLDKKKIRSQFFCLLSIISIFSISGIVVSTIVTDSSASKVIFFISLGVLTKNISTFNMYAFQMTNRLLSYSKAIVTQKLVFGIGSVLLLLSGIRSFELFCLFDLFADVIVITVFSFQNREIICGCPSPVKESLAEMARNISAGIFLLVSNVVSMLFVGLVRMFVQWHWDLATFGRLSYAFSLVNLFLTFVTAVSIVVFPTIKRLSNERLPSLYVSLRGRMSVVMTLLLALYFPVCMVLKKWLPDYLESFRYMGYLLPVIIFSSSVSLLGNNFINAYREERRMFVVNISSLLVLAAMMFVGIHLESIEFMLLSLVAVMFVRSVYADRCLQSEIGMSFVWIHLFEISVTLCFVLSASILDIPDGIAFALYILFLTVAVSIFRKKLLRR